MELAIPLVALGGLYIISNKKESFAVSRPSEILYKPNKQPKKESSFTDMAGRTVDMNKYSGNMVPYFGKSKNIGNTLTNFESEQILDANGAGSLHINKKEISPLFKPQENLQWANGTPNQSQFYQSRVNPSQSMNSIKPFQEIHVAPGMNQGYGFQGSGGFNSGTESRDTWIDKTVDELRVATKPKTSFSLDTHEGPAQTLVKNLGIEGKVEKYLPDTFYINTPDRYLTTTGATLGPTQHSEQPNPTIHRATTSQSYSGPAGNVGVQSQAKHGMYRADHRQPLGSEHLSPAFSPVHKNEERTIQPLVPTNRSIQSSSFFGGMGGLISAITAPITDLVRPTQKEEIIGLTRNGNMGTTVSNPTIQDVFVPPTIKQSTIYSPYQTGSRMYKPVTDGGYQVTEQQPIQNERDTTSVSYMGGGMSVLPMSTQPDLNVSISANRMTQGRIAGGNVQTFNPTINQSTSSYRSNMHTPYTGNVGSTLYQASPSVDLCGGGNRTPTKYHEEDRNTPDLLQAFKQNPYTQSLHSAS
jgi:hypothetical protein